MTHFHHVSIRKAIVQHCSYDTQSAVVVVSSPTNNGLAGRPHNGSSWVCLATCSASLGRLTTMHHPHSARTRTASGEPPSRPTPGHRHSRNSFRVHTRHPSVGARGSFQETTTTTSVNGDDDGDDRRQHHRADACTRACMPKVQSPALVTVEEAVQKQQTTNNNKQPSDGRTDSGRTKDEGRMAEGRTTNDERRTTNDERRTTNDEGRRTKDEGRRTKDEGRRTKDERRRTTMTDDIQSVSACGREQGQKSAEKS